MVNPAVAVADDFIAAFVELAGDFGVALQRHGGGKEGGGHLAAVEDAQQPPHAGARAVFVHGFLGEVALVVHVEGQLVHAVIHAVAHGEGFFGAFFVIDDDVDGDFGAPVPADAGRALAVANDFALGAADAGQVVVAIPVVFGDLFRAGHGMGLSLWVETAGF